MYAELKKKIARRPPGQGAEAQLTKPELRTLLNTGRFALVSAGPNPNEEADKGMTAEQAKDRHEQLRKRLVASGYMHTQVVGHYGGVEDSFLVMVHDAERRDVRALGQMFKQDSVIYADKGHNEAHYTHGDRHDQGLCSEGKGWSEKPSAGDYYSILRHPDGTTSKFALNIDFDHATPCKKSLSKGLDKPPAGFSPAPHSRKGGYRKKVHGEYVYWYPGEGLSSRPEARGAGKPKKDDSEPSGRLREGQTLPVFEGSRTSKETNPGTWKMEHGAFRMKKVRSYEAAADRGQIRSTRLEPSVDDHSKMQLVKEYDNLIRKEAKDAMRLHAIRSRYELSSGRSTNDTMVELQRAGVEGMLQAVRAYRGRVPFAMYAKQYVRDYVRMEAGRQSRLHLPEMHMRNLRRFIAAKVKAQVKFHTDNATHEQIASVFDLRLKHVHGGLAPVHRNEPVPMEPYKLEVGRRGTSIEGREQTVMRDVEKRRGRLAWVKMYDEYLKGRPESLSDDNQSLFDVSTAIGTAFSTEDQIIVKNQLERVFDKLATIPRKFEIEDRAPGRYDVKTQYRVENMGDVLRRRLGVGKYDEHTVAELAAKVPIYRKDAEGNWREVGERSARTYMQRFVEMGMDQLRSMTTNADDRTRYVVDRAADLVAPEERIPTGPSYFERIKEIAKATPKEEVAAYFTRMMDQLTRLKDSDVTPERKRIYQASLKHLQDMSSDDLAVEAAKASEAGRKLTREMHAAMTRFIDIERVSPHDGVAYMVNPSTGAAQSMRVKMGYDKDWEPTSPAGQPLIRKGFELLTDSILREIQRYPETMALATSTMPPTPERGYLERLIR